MCQSLITFFVTFQEIDYSNEGRNAERFGKNFAEFDWVKVPKIYWEYTTPQVSNEVAVDCYLESWLLAKVSSLRGWLALYQPR